MRGREEFIAKVKSMWPAWEDDIFRNMQDVEEGKYNSIKTHGFFEITSKDGRIKAVLFGKEKLEYEWSVGD